VQAAGTDASDDVVKNLEGKEVNDFFLRNGKIRAEDHRVVHDVYLAEVKPKSQVTEDYDYEKIVTTIPADKAFKPVAESTCSMS
jgi:branched-chain amino acid transport system substrate-binding protein